MWTWRVGCGTVPKGSDRRPSVPPGHSPWVGPAICPIAQPYARHTSKAPLPRRGDADYGHAFHRGHPSGLVVGERMDDIIWNARVGYLRGLSPFLIKRPARASGPEPLGWERAPGHVFTMHLLVARAT